MTATWVVAGSEAAYRCHLEADKAAGGALQISRVSLLSSSAVDDNIAICIVSRSSFLICSIFTSAAATEDSNSLGGPNHWVVVKATT
jgi:hypothetical protein